jgi:glycosyltransferase involved in cell wall biosynthesis
MRPLSLADKIITFSKFGQNELKKQGYVSEMIYEGVDVNILKPKDKVEARKKLGLPQDVFIWGMIAANKENPPRKSFQEAIEAFKVFSDAHPEARLFIHTQQIAPGNFPIREYVQYLGVAEKVFFLDQMIASFFATREDIETQYNAMDALLNPSQTEGFGLTIVEAQACGKPVVVNNCHSMPELIIPGKTGEIAEVYTRRWTNALSFWEVPSPETIWVAMEKVYQKLKENPHQVEDNCRKNVVDNFNIDTIFKEKWLKYFLRLQDEILPL